MKKIRCMLLCLSVLSALCLTAGCRKDNKKESTSGADFTETSSQSQSSASGGPSAAGSESTSYGAPTDVYDGTSYEYENGAGSMATGEGIGQNGADRVPATSEGGLMNDLGEDITSAVDDLRDNLETTKAR